MTRAVAAVLALVILSVGGVYGFQAALENAGEDHTIVNESWTATQGSVTVLEKSNINGAYYDTNVTVYNKTSGGSTEMDRGTDYEWFVGNGTVKALSGGDLEGDALITYGYQRTTEEQRQLAALAGQLPRALALILPGLAFVFFVAFLRG